MKVKHLNSSVELKEEYAVIIRAVKFLETCYYHKGLNVALACDISPGVSHLFNTFDEYCENLDEDDNFISDIDDDSILLALQALNYQAAFDGCLDDYELSEINLIVNDLLSCVELDEQEARSIKY